ncbi:MAG: DUF1428 domain-containing protein [Phyllobacteriaceae bacterium]|nr:DUF1428 domain-containing protein [Phyllobacteriaceae bacterium]
MAYVDGYLIAVPNASKAAYVEMAEKMAVVFKTNGATRVVENWEDDVPEGKLTSFPMAVKREAGESIVFSWVAWPTREIRDAGWKQVMEDPIMNESRFATLFDGKRMIYGGFETVVDM